MHIEIKLMISILVVTSCRHVVGKEFMGSPSIEHWLRTLNSPADCEGAAAGDMVTDPDDCTKFFLCTDEGVMSPDSFSCPDEFDGSICFDPSSPGCSDDKDKCDAACLATVPTCQTECLLALDHIADITDCSKHFICLGDAPDPPRVEVPCPAERPYFNGKECTNDKSACCNCQVETCTTLAAGAKIANPDDCHSYFTCVESGGNLTPVGPIACSGSGSFINGDCDSATTECENACDLGEGSSTSSTISTASTVTSASSVNTASTLTTASSDSTGSTSESTSDSTVTTVSSTPTTSSGTECIDLSDFTCPAKGSYARCPFCDNEYFYCNRNGAEPMQADCAGDLVFNPNPCYPSCILPVNCPFCPTQ